MTAQAKIDSTPLSLVAAADLSLKLWRFGKMTATGINVCTVAGERAAGVIGAMYKKTPAAGDYVDFYIERLSIVEASGVIAVDDPLTTDANGKAKTAGAGDVINGYAVDAATADTQLIRWRPARNINAAAINVASNQVAPGSLVTYLFAIPDAADADYDIVITDKIEVLDVFAQKQNGAGAANTMTLKNAGNAISDAMACAVDKAVTHAATIDDAFSVVNAGGTLRVSAHRAAGTSNALVTVIGVKRA